MKKKGGISKRRGAGKVLLATTLAGTAATSAMTQSTTTSANFITDTAKKFKSWWYGTKGEKEKLTHEMNRADEIYPIPMLIMGLTATATYTLSHDIIHNPVTFIATALIYDIFGILAGHGLGSILSRENNEKYREFKELANSIEQDLNLLLATEISGSTVNIKEKFDAKKTIQKFKLKDDSLKKNFNSEDLKFRINYDDTRLWNIGDIKIVDKNSDDIIATCDGQLLLESPSWRKHLETNTNLKTDPEIAASQKYGKYKTDLEKQELLDTLVNERWNFDELFGTHKNKSLLEKPSKDELRKIIEMKNELNNNLKIGVIKKEEEGKTKKFVCISNNDTIIKEIEIGEENEYNPDSSANAFEFRIVCGNKEKNKIDSIEIINKNESHDFVLKLEKEVQKHLLENYSSNYSSEFKASDDISPKSNAALQEKTLENQDANLTGEKSEERLKKELSQLKRKLEKI